MKTTPIIIALLLCWPTIAGLSQNNTVGTINGTLEVSPGGAAVYTINIDLPPGRGGLTPQLALQYNSQGETGVLGKGWGINGWLFVERVGQSKYYDQVEVPGAIDFTDDRFSLNGTRIIKVSQQPNFSRLEHDDLSLITQPSRPSVGKDSLNDKNNHWYWMVQTNDGLTRHFGETDESRQSNGEAKLPIRWHLSRIVDLLGNEIVYEYQKIESAGEIYLSEIKYGPYRINFTYGMLIQNDEMTSYFPYSSDSYSYSVKRILNAISVIYHPTNEVIKLYNLDYDNGGIFKRKFLNQVSLTGMNSETIASTSFEWEYNQGSLGAPVYFIDKTTKEYRNVVEASTTGDFNGDGKTDFVEWDRTEHKTRIYMNNSEYEINFTGILFVGDFFGEGAESLLISELTGQKRQRIYSFRNGNFVQVGIERANVQVLHVGDFSGNGLIDMITKEGNLHYFYPGTNNFDTFFTATNQKTLGQYPSNVIRTGNFRGNGQLGLLAYNSGAVNCFNLAISNGAYFMKSHLHNHSFFNLNVNPVAIETGDFNGDGKDDLLVVHFNGGHEHTIFYSAGNGFISYAITVDHIWWDKDYVIADLNNDGISDIYYQTRNIDYINRKLIVNNTCLYKHSGVNAGFTTVEGVEEIMLPDKIISIEDHKLLHVGDFSGDGEKEVFMYFEVVFGDHVNAAEDKYAFYQNWRRGFYFHNNGAPEDRIVQITNGLGASQQISYKPYNPASYTAGVNFPVMKYRYPFSTVYTIATQIPNSSDYYPETQYTFSGMQLHTQGKGMLGFQLTEVTNGMTNTLTTTTNDLLIKNLNGVQHYFHPYATTLITQDKSTNKTISRTDVQMDILNLVNGKPLIYMPVATTIITANSDNDTDNTLINRSVTLQSISDFDEYGNSTKSVQRASIWRTNPNEEWEFNTTKTAAYFPPTAQQWVIVPDWVETRVTSMEDNYNELVERFEFTYYANKLLKTKTFLPGNKTSEFATHETYKYNNSGNLIFSSLVALNNSELEERVADFEYDATERFVTRKSILSNDSDNLVTEYDYCPKLGRLLWERDIRGNPTNYEYDGFGKLTKTYHSDGTTSHIDIDWAKHELAPNGAVYQLTSFKPHRSDVWHESTVFFDALGRELRNVGYNLQGDPVAVDKEYDQLGRLYRVSEPFFAAKAPSLFTTYTYDGLGRIVEVTAPDGTNTETVYKGGTTRTTNKATNVWSEKISNAIGLTDWSKDPTGQINFDYNGRGQLIQVDAQGLITTVLYDIAGNQSELRDPNAGTTIYQYNAYGELTSQTDANGNTYIMTYDNLGRLLTKTLASGGSDQTTIEYYTLNTDIGFGLPKLQWRNNNTSTAFTYDILGRIISKTESIDGINFTFAYTYNTATGMLETYQYPSGYKLKYLYNNRGNQHEIRNALTNAVLWKAIEENQRGQLTEYTMGQGGIHAFKGFSKHGYPQLLQTYDFFKNTPQTIQDLHYNFSTETGNLTSRTDNITGQSESFTYDTDKLHSRLTSWSVNGQTVASLVYGDNGNINKKSDVSTANNSYSYQHPQGKPHAVTGVSNPTAVFQQNSLAQSVVYTPFNKVSLITNGFAPYFMLAFTYGPDDQRSMTKLYRTSPTTPDLIKYFADNYEYETGTLGVNRHLHYLNSPDGLFAIMVKQGSTETMYYVHKDYLGSITAITDATGNLVESLSYDPWGRRRKATDWTDYNVTTTLFDRGFTGHEHLPQFGLINMNGRVYDPFLARFLSPDPFIQAPTYTQNYNRYSYAFNNPLKYTDPDGEWAHIAVGAMIGGYLNVVANAKNIQNPWQMLGYFGVGAVAGGLSAGIGAGIGSALAGKAAAGGGFLAGFAGTATKSSTGFVAGAISGAAAGFTNGLVSGTGNQLIQGKKFGDAFVKGGLGQAWRQGLGGTAFGGIMGAIDARLNNEDWLTGSPYKRHRFSDGNETFTHTGINSGKGVLLPDTNTPYSIDITAPRGWGLPAEGADGYTLASSKGYDFHPVLSRTGSKTLNIEFPLGTPGGGAFGIKVEAPMRIINANNRVFRHEYFFSNDRSLSPLFWFVKYLKLNQL